MNYFSQEVVGIKRALMREAQPWLLLLQGDLGAGKTTFAKELLEAWGGDVSQVQSPTFLKVLEYKIPQLGLVLHLDAYRMESVDEFAKLGLESYEEVSLMIVEWPELFVEALEKYPLIKAQLALKSARILDFKMDGTTRKIEVRKMPI